MPDYTVPKAIVPRTRTLVPIKELDIKYIIGKSKLDYQQVISFIMNIMNETLDLTINETEEWIDEFVPKRSGDLIESLKKFLNKSRPPSIIERELQNVRLVLGVGEEIKYAKYVIEMTDAQVQHEGTWFEHSGKRAYSKGERVFLDDPEARGKFFDMLVIYSRERLRMNLSKIKWIHIKSG